MKLAIGTTRAPKIAWIKSWVTACPYLQDTEVEYFPHNVESGISDMPLTTEEIMLWAKNRAQNLKSLESADYYIWIEGGTAKIWDKAYIFWVVYVENHLWEWHYGFSPHLEVPSIVEKKLYEQWLELGPIMGELSGNTNIRS